MAREHRSEHLKPGHLLEQITSLGTHTASHILRPMEEGP
jgi:hypothetical protein